MEAFFQFKPEILEESVHGRPALYPFRFAMGVCSSGVHVFRGLKKDKKRPTVLFARGVSRTSGGGLQVTGVAVMCLLVPG